MLFIKLWMLCLKLQYSNEELAKVVDKTQIPLLKTVYDKVYPLFQEALQVTKTTNERTKKLVFYEEFAKDTVLLF